MASGTVEFVVDTHIPNKEVVRLNLADGDTYVSRKFNTIQAAEVTANVDTDAHINVTYSGQTATINFASVTASSDVTLVLWGE